MAVLEVAVAVAVLRPLTGRATAEEGVQHNKEIRVEVVGTEQRQPTKALEVAVVAQALRAAGVGKVRPRLVIKALAEAAEMEKYHH
jgi:glycine/D-amino acid oxidase-like deaminating enzyme